MNTQPWRATWREKRTKKKALRRMVDQFAEGNPERMRALIPTLRVSKDQKQALLRFVDELEQEMRETEVFLKK